MNEENIKKDIDRLMKDWDLEGLVIHAEHKGGTSTCVYHGTYHIGEICLNEVKAFAEHLKNTGRPAGEAADMLSTVVAVTLAQVFGSESVNEMAEALEKATEADKKTLTEKEEKND